MESGTAASAPIGPSSQPQNRARHNDDRSEIEAAPTNRGLIMLSMTMLMPM